MAVQGPAANLGLRDEDGIAVFSQDLNGGSVDMAEGEAHDATCLEGDRGFSGPGVPSPFPDLSSKGPGRNGRHHGLQIQKLLWNESEETRSF